MRRVVAGLVLGLALVVQVPVAGEAQPDRLGAAVGPIRLVPTGDDPIQIAGLHGYFGRIEIGSASDGLVVSNRLPLERYLLGLAEVPLTWPEEALKAQAVAARTYALYTLRQPPGGSAATYGFDICASVQCQVYSGADVVAPVTGLRWRRAVADTAGISVLYREEPILARYHSTSGGRTLDNPQAFPTEPAYPYLRGVESATEQASPLYRWSVDFPIRRLQRMLRVGSVWPKDNGRLRDVRSRPSSAGFHYPDLVLRGANGSVRATAEEVRTVLRDVAPRLFPDDYPSRAATGSGRLPETWPSNRIEVFTVRDRVRVIGRGWGHGVGMSQWGAHGLAERGASYVDILSHYYTGVRVGEFPDPGPIEVGLDWARSEVTATGEFKIVDGRGETLIRDALGQWRFGWPGMGVVSIDPPTGFGLPLRIGLVDAPERVEVGDTVYLTVALSRPARVRTVTRAPTAYEDPGVRVAKAGRRRIMWPAPLEEGRFRVLVEAMSGPTRSRTRAVEIEVFSKPVEADEPDDPGAVGTPGRPGGLPLPLLLGAAAVALVGVVGVAVGRRAGRRLKE